MLDGKTASPRIYIISVANVCVSCIYLKKCGHAWFFLNKPRASHTMLLGDVSVEQSADVLITKQRATKFARIS